MVFLFFNFKDSVLKFTRGLTLTVELFNLFFRRHGIIEPVEPSAAGRITNWSDLFLGLYCYTTFIYFPVENGGSSSYF